MVDKVTIYKDSILSIINLEELTKSVSQGYPKDLIIALEESDKKEENGNSLGVFFIRFKYEVECLIFTVSPYVLGNNDEYRPFVSASLTQIETAQLNFHAKTYNTLSSYKFLVRQTLKAQLANFNSRHGTLPKRVIFYYDNTDSDAEFNVLEEFDFNSVLIYYNYFPEFHFISMADWGSYNFNPFKYDVILTNPSNDDYYGGLTVYKIDSRFSKITNKLIQEFTNILCNFNDLNLMGCKPFLIHKNQKILTLLSVKDDKLTLDESKINESELF